jgi:hypothetical protein
VGDICKPDVLAKYHEAYDNINWDAEVQKNPTLARHLGSQVNYQGTMAGATFQNCNITIQVVADSEKENKPPSSLVHRK